MALNTKLSSLIVAILFMFFGLAMIQPLSDYVYTLNTTALELLTGGTALVTLIGFLPFIFGAGVILGGMAIIWRVTSSG
jgi:hypothetical protein